MECGDFCREDGGGGGGVAVAVRRMERRREELGVKGTIRWSGGEVGCFCFCSGVLLRFLDFLVFGVSAIVTDCGGKGGGG